MTTREGFDEEKLVSDLAFGRYSYRQLAERHGLSASMVGKIARGQRRSDLSRRAGWAREYFLDQARLRLARASLKAVRTLERAMGNAQLASAISAARGVLTLTMPKERPAATRSRPDPWPRRPKPEPLTREQLRQIERDLDDPPPGSDSPAPWGEAVDAPAPAAGPRAHNL